jgi:hypothetical protein
VNVDELFAPLQYQIAWAIIAGSLVVLALVFYIIMFVLTRKVKIQTEIKPLPKMANLAEKLSLIKNKYAQDVILVGELHSKGEISTRTAFQSLSVHLRNFTHEYSQTGAYSMTLTDLTKNQAPPLLKDKIRNFYPVAFEEAERNANVKLAVKDALEVIQLWH